MPSPYPKYQPIFTSEEVEQARTVMGQHTAPHNQVVRAKMVLILAKHSSIGNDELAEEAGVHYHTACKWRKRWATEGFSLQDRPRSGRPATFSPSADS